MSGTDSRTGWLAVGTAFVALGVTFGVSYNFGSLVVPMRSSLGISASQASWVFSVFTCTFLALSGVTGKLSDRYGPRPLLTAGGLLIGGGLALTATAGEVMPAVLGYLAVGVGAGCVYVPAVANVGAWFVRHRVHAIGIAVTGIGVGTVVGPLVTATLVEAIGWRRTEWWLGAVALLVLLACAWVTPVAASGRRATPAMAIRDLVGDRLFRVLYASGFAMGLVLYVPFVFIAPMAVQSGADPVRAASLISVIGFASTAARMLFGLIAARIGVVAAYRTTIILIWASFLILVPARSFGALLIFALIFGAAYGGNIALMPAMLGHFYGVASLGTVTGALFTSASVGALLGAPLIGLIVGASGGYLLPALVTLAIATLGSVGQVFLPSRIPSR
jgi:MFS family permease